MEAIFKKIKKSHYLRHDLTNFNKIYYGDASEPFASD